jgi:hypothetical protein
LFIGGYLAARAGAFEHCIDSAGYFHLVGEVENVSPNPVELVKVIGTFYDVDGK